MPTVYRLKRLTFASGVAPDSPITEIEPATVVVLVGPNNSGKSTALREIEYWCHNDQQSPGVMQFVETSMPHDYQDFEELIRTFETNAPSGGTNEPGIIWLGQTNFAVGQEHGFVDFPVELSKYRAWIEKGEYHNIRSLIGSLFTIRLDGRTRLQLTDPQPTGDLLRHPANHLAALFQNDDSRRRMRELTEQAFGLYFVIDTTDLQNFRVKMSEVPPRTSSEEQGIDASARAFHSAAADIGGYGDGVRAYVGLLAATLSLPHSILLIDEPEAFLHPPLARRLGSNLARLADQRNASLVVATHSADFVMGCLEAIENVNIVRLEFDGKVASARSLGSADLAEVARDPLMRSSGVLQALFHRGAIVTESEADRAFYDDINFRLVQVDRGVPDALVLNSLGKASLYRIVGPLREIGVPAATISDLDLIRGDAPWSRLLRACCVPKVERERLDVERNYLVGKFAGLPNGLKSIKTLGIPALELADQARASDFLESLAKYGVFLVRLGELESWLKRHNIHGHGPAWVTEAFEVMGQGSANSQNLQPQSDDVWEFIDSISAWINDPRRQGMS